MSIRSATRVIRPLTVPATSRDHGRRGLYVQLFLRWLPALWSAIVDPLGAATKLSYGGPFDDATAITDSKGNTTNFKFDANGNLTSLTFADGASAQNSYDSHGNLTVT